jgi:hypothetical protein
MKREALEKMNRQANEMPLDSGIVAQPGSAPALGAEKSTPTTPSTSSNY